jgi:Uma2 family endonuclease
MLTKAKATVADYRKLPEGAKYQLIDGEIVEMPSPTLKHQKIVVSLVTQMNNIASQKQNGTVLITPMDVFLSEENTFQPDILFVLHEHADRLQSDGVHGPPDVVIEILSPSTGYYDMKKKFQVYEKYGVQEYFIVDPEDLEVVGYRSNDGRFHEFLREKGRFTSQLLDGEILFA